MPDEALTLSKYEAQVTHDDVTKAVDEAIQRNFNSIMSRVTTIVPNSSKTV